MCSLQAWCQLRTPAESKLKGILADFFGGFLGWLASRWFFDNNFLHVCGGVEMTAKECVPPDIFSQVVLCEVGNDAA